MKQSEATVLFYGDSRAADWPPPDLPGVSFINRGIPGEATSGSLRRFGRDVAMLSPDIVVLQAGINDLVAIEYVPRERAVIIDRCQHNIQQLIDQSLNLGATVILTTIFPPAPAGFEFLGYYNLDSTMPALVEVNDFLRGLVHERVIIFDAYALLAKRGRVKPAYALDLLHLNPSGYAALNQALAPLLRQLLGDRAG